MARQLEKRLVESNADLDILKAELAELAKQAVKNVYNRAALRLGWAGFNIAIPSHTNDEQDLRALQDGASQIKNYYGGFMSVNVYAGFTAKQLEALRIYLRKYFPNTRVSLMPVEKLKFRSTTNLDSEGNQSGLGYRYFTNIAGAGDYLGSVITLDASVGTAMGMEHHVGPFILPVGIKADLKQKSEPFDAELICDFSSGFTVAGEANVRDGWIFWDNDLNNDMHASDLASGACYTRLYSGDENSAVFAAMKELETKFEAMRIARVELSKKEKEAYFNSVLSDIERNRRGGQRYERITYIYNRYGWKATVVEALSRAVDFHWHTNVQNVSNISSVKFNKRITMNGHQTVNHDLPVNLCLVYNPEHSAYDRCTEEELDQAQTMQQAVEEAQNSPECLGIYSPIECGQKRDQHLRLPAGTVRSYEGDRMVESSI